MHILNIYYILYLCYAPVLPLNHNINLHCSISDACYTFQTSVYCLHYVLLNNVNKKRPAVVLKLSQSPSLLALHKPLGLMSLSLAPKYVSIYQM